MVLPRLDSITLDAPGAEPRAPLRYAFAGSVDQRFRTEMRARHDKGGSGSAEWKSPGAIVQGFTVTAAPKGVGLRVLKPEGDSAWVGGVDQDRHLGVAVDDQGRLGTVAFTDAPDAKPRDLDEVTQRLLGFGVPVPTEPVGVGAKWTVVWILRNVAVQKQTATYALTAIDHGQWKIAVELQRIGERQVLKDSGVEIIASNRHYKGSVVIDPTKLLPVDGKLDGDSITQLRTAKTEEVLEEQGTVTFIAK